MKYGNIARGQAQGWVPVFAAMTGSGELDRSLRSRERGEIARFARVKAGRPLRSRFARVGEEGLVSARGPVGRSLRPGLEGSLAVGKVARFACVREEGSLASLATRPHRKVVVRTSLFAVPAGPPTPTEARRPAKRQRKNPHPPNRPADGESGLCLFP